MGKEPYEDYLVEKGLLMKKVDDKVVIAAVCTQILFAEFMKTDTLV